MVTTYFIPPSDEAALDNLRRIELMTAVLLPATNTLLVWATDLLANVTDCSSKLRDHEMDDCSLQRHTGLVVLRPPVGVQSLAVVQRPTHGPWRVALLLLTLGPHPA